MNKEFETSYPSKISKILVILTAVIALIPSAAVLKHSNDHNKIINTIVLSGLGFIILIYFLYTTKYMITNKYLQVSTGFFKYKPIPVSSIHHIRSTNSIIAAPASSFDRIELRFNKYDLIILSPKDKASFISHLLQLNPKIRVEL